jgi:hypothetical protein
MELNPVLEETLPDDLLREASTPAGTPDNDKLTVPLPLIPAIDMVLVPEDPLETVIAFGFIVIE